MTEYAEKVIEVPEDLMAQPKWCTEESTVEDLPGRCRPFRNKCSGHNFEQLVEGSSIDSCDCEGRCAGSPYGYTVCR